MAKGALKWVLYAASAVLILLGILFIMASYANTMRFVEGLVFMGIAIILLYFSREKKPLEIRQTLELSGDVKIKEIKCTNCSAILNPDTIQVISGKPYIKCEYCGNRFEITEEPKW